MIKRAFTPYSSICLVLGNQWSALKGQFLRIVSLAHLFKNTAKQFESGRDDAVLVGFPLLPPLPAEQHGLPLRRDRSSLELPTLDEGKGLKVVKWRKKQSKKVEKEGNHTEGRMGGRESG